MSKLFIGKTKLDSQAKGFDMADMDGELNLDPSKITADKVLGAGEQPLL